MVAMLMKIEFVELVGQAAFALDDATLLVEEVLEGGNSFVRRLRRFFWRVLSLLAGGLSYDWQASSTFGLRGLAFIAGNHFIRFLNLNIG